jgi:hypothetical protein
MRTLEVPDSIDPAAAVLYDPASGYWQAFSSVFHKASYPSNLARLKLGPPRASQAWALADLAAGVPFSEWPCWLAYPHVHYEFEQGWCVRSSVFPEVPYLGAVVVYNLGPYRPEKWQAELDLSDLLDKGYAYCDSRIDLRKSLSGPWWVVTSCSLLS